MNRCFETTVGFNGNPIIFGNIAMGIRWVILVDDNWRIEGRARWCTFAATLGVERAGDSLCTCRNVSFVTRLSLDFVCLAADVGI